VFDFGQMEEIVFVLSICPLPGGITIAIITGIA
jgi:hypothetical protein